MRTHISWNNPDHEQYMSLQGMVNRNNGPINHRIGDRLALVKSLFTAEECREIMTAIEEFPTSPGTVLSPEACDESYDVPRKPTIMTSLRSCLVTYFEHTAQTSWFLNRIENTMAYQNEKVWHLDITDYSQPPRLMTYFEGHHFQSLHSDSGPGDTSYRKLTSI